jgi:hypothetical protein
MQDRESGLPRIHLLGTSVNKGKKKGRHHHHKVGPGKNSRVVREGGMARRPNLRTLPLRRSGGIGHIDDFCVGYMDDFRRCLGVASGGELRRMPLPRRSVNKAHTSGRAPWAVLERESTPRGIT